jgi:hypothetical protein
MSGSSPPLAPLRKAIALTIAALGGVWAGAAAAQETATARMAAVIDTPVIIINSTDMDFGRIVATVPGTVLMTPALSASCTVTGGLVRTGPCQAAKFDGRVRFLFPLQITPPSGNAIDLTGPGGATMRLDNFTFRAGPGLLNLGTNRFLILNLDGSYSFYTGGTLHVGANQLPGVYNGTFEIMLNYN